MWHFKVYLKKWSKKTHVFHLFIALIILTLIWNTIIILNQPYISDDFDSFSDDLNSDHLSYLSHHELAKLLWLKIELLKKELEQAKQLENEVINFLEVDHLKLEGVVSKSIPFKTNPVPVTNVSKAYLSSIDKYYNKTLDKLIGDIYSPYYHPAKFQFKKQDVFIKKYSGLSCFEEGTNTKATLFRTFDACSCVEGWHNIACSVPDIVFHSNYPHSAALSLRKTPRKIIVTMPFSHEFDLLEAKIIELYDVVDAFFILEANFTAFGNYNDRQLLNKLMNSYMANYVDKIVYIPLNRFPISGKRDGWAIDELLRSHIGDVLLRYFLPELQDDDIVICLDADELPLREAIIFLKVNDGYPEPVGFNFQQNIFKFTWLAKSLSGDEYVSNIFGACSISYLLTMLEGNIYFLRSAHKTAFGDSYKVDKLRKESAVRVQPWSFGGPKNPAGWHCSWCFTIDGIQYKLRAAHSSDEPRWGNFEEKTTSIFIHYLIQSGTWFDNITKFIMNNFSDPFFAPKYIKDKEERFSYLLK